MDRQVYSKIAIFIDENPIAILGTVDEQGSPHGSVVYICADPARPFAYFLTKTGTEKYQNLLTRPRVSLTIVNPQRVATLQVQGEAGVVRDAETIDMVSKKITRSHAYSEEWLPPIAKLRAGAYVLIGIRLTKARLGEYKGKSIGDSTIFTEFHASA